MSYLDDFDRIQTLMPLDYLREMIGVDPYHFWQMTFGDAHPLRGYGKIYPHARWMYANMAMPGTSAKRGPGRLEFLERIAQAESKIANVPALSTWPAVKYTENEEIRLLKKRNPTSYKTTTYPFTTAWQHIQTVGVRTLTPIDVGAVLVYVADSDDVTCVVTSTAVVGEIVVTYPDSDVQIRPISVSKVGNIATITIKRWLLALPILWNDGNAIDATDVSNLLVTVGVYREWIDTSQQLSLAWEPGITSCGCLDSECAICSLYALTGCAIMKQPQFGILGWQLSTYADGAWGASAQIAPYKGRFPDIVYVSYTHGFDSGADRYMNSIWRHAVSALTISLLPRWIIDTTTEPETMGDWREDKATSVSGGRRHMLSRSDLNCPFGTRRGALEAWHAVKSALGE